MKLRRNEQKGSTVKAGEPSWASTSEEETFAPSLAEGISVEELALVEKMEREVGALHAKPSRKLEWAIAIILVLLSIVGIIGSRTITVRTETGGVDPRWWPTVIFALMLALSFLLAFIAYTKPPFDREDLEVTNRGGWDRLIWTTIFLTLYIVAWTLSENFAVPSVVLLAVLMWVYDGRGWRALVIYPVVTVTFISLLFHTLLKVPL